MNNLKMFCISLDPKHYEYISGLGYIPVGVGESSFDDYWFTDRTKNNIAKKNKVKPIIGYEAYITTESRFERPDRDKNKRYHLTLLAENNEG